MMRWALLSLLFLLLGAALYAAFVFTSTNSDRAAPPRSTAQVPQIDSQQASRVTSEAGANGSQAVTSDTAGQAQITTSQFPNWETSTGFLNELAPVNTAPPSDKQHPWGQMLRGAPVHNGPDVSSAVLGYVAAGTEMQILERELGWVKVLDPETARQGWVYETHVVAKEGPDTTGQEAALADDVELGASEKPSRSFKSQKSRKKHFSKKHFSKKRRYYGEHRRRRLLGFFRFRRF